MPPTLHFDRSDRLRLIVAGPQAVATLNGLVTNDVAALVPGQGVYGAILTPKGKIIADLRVFALGDRMLVDTSAAAATGLRAALGKYVNPRLAKVDDVSGSLRDLGIFGATAREVVAATTGVSTEALGALGDYAHLTTDGTYGTLVIARTPELGVEGYDLFVAEPFASSLSGTLAAGGAPRGDMATWDALRVAAGRPEWGRDMDDGTLPQEANFDALHGVSYDKGCYVGQETVARIHFRGHVNRTLRRLRIVGTATPPRGATLVTTEHGEGSSEPGSVVGDIRSVVRQSDDTVLAIGMVRRELEAPAVLQARWDDDTAEVHLLGPADGRGSTIGTSEGR